MYHLLSKMQHKYKGIPDLMKYIVIGSVIVYLLGFLGVHTTKLLGLAPDAVLGGQVWRVLSFLFLMPVGNILFAAFAFYFYYIVGQALEREWGSFIFTLYYFCTVLLTVIISLLSGTPVYNATYVNLSLFLAFGYLYPDFSILLFMIIPIKMKYLAIFYGVFALFQAITLVGWGAKCMALVGVFTFVLFFYQDLWELVKNRTFIYKNKQNFRKNRGSEHLRIIRHQCEICKKTELDDSHLEFRYCSGCDGYHEYCLEHLNNHVHVKDLD